MPVAVCRVGYGGWTPTTILHTDLPNPTRPGVPQAPHLVVASSDTLTVAWDVVADDGGAQVLVYELAMAKAGSSVFALVFQGQRPQPHRYVAALNTGHSFSRHLYAFSILATYFIVTSDYPLIRCRHCTIYPCSVSRR